MTAMTTHGADLAEILRVYNDVTERLKRSHEALAGEVCRLRDELHEKNVELQRRERLSALGQMAAGVAHEIRNPLGGIGLYASMLERDLVDRPSEQELARKISSGVQNVEHIVRDILSFAGGAAPRFERISMNRILEGVVAQALPQANSFGIRVDVDWSLGAEQLFADPGQVERALVNLVFNAMEAVGTGGTVWIRRASDHDSADRVAIAVEDDGPGIEPRVLQKMFNPFFTTKDNGTGLGLAIVHGIAEAHGGCIRAGNRDGGGASLVLTLPGGAVADRHGKYEETE